MKNPAARITVIFLFSMLSACGGGSDDNSPETSPGFAGPEFGGVVNGFNAVSSTRSDMAGGITGRTTYQHDAVTKTRTWTDFDGLGAVRFSEVCSYNEFGREIGCESFDENGSYDKSDAYDIENGLIIKRRRFNKNTDNELSVVDFTYDENRNLLQRVYTSADESGQRTEFRKTTYSYDANNRRVSGAESFDGAAPTVYTYLYNDLGQINRVNIVNNNGLDGGFETVDYDENGNVIRRTFNGEFETITSDYQYEKSSFTVVNHLLRILQFWL